MTRAFFARPTLAVARDLVGKVLVQTVRGRSTAGVIVEVEAYIGESDPACHAAPGPTRRNAPLYGPPGFAYVYLNYGLHALVNVVTEPDGSPAAVLIRALEPLEGVDLMRRRRVSARRLPGRRARVIPGRPIRTGDLCRGPGNLTVAMGISLHDNRADMTTGGLRIEDRGIAAPRISWTPRVGIRVGTERPWRAIWEGHPSVSGPARVRGGSAVRTAAAPGATARWGPGR